MTVEGLLGRAAVGLAAIALLGMGAYLLGGEPRQVQHRAWATASQPPLAEAAGRHVGDQAPAVWLSNAATVPDAGVPQLLIDPFAAAEDPVAADGVAGAADAPPTNSLGPMLMNAGVVMPFSLGAKLFQAASPMLDGSVVEALPPAAVPVDAIPVDAVPAF